MRLEHIEPSKNVIDISITFTPDMGAVYGPAVDVQPALQSIAPEAVLISGLGMLSVIAGVLIYVGFRLWKDFKRW